MAMKNFICEELDRHGRLVYWHRHVVTERDVHIALEYGIPIEVDTAYDERQKTPFVGHPLLYYSDVIHQPAPQNLPLETIIDLIKIRNLHVVFDCKDRRVLPYLESVVCDIGNANVAFDCFIKEWAEPYPDGVAIEAHWACENISAQDVRLFRSATGAFWMGLIRGFNLAWLNKMHAARAIVETAVDTVDGVAAYLPFRYLPFPPVPYYQEIARHSLIPVLSTDLLLRRLPFRHIGVTELPRRATRVA